MEYEVITVEGQEFDHDYFYVTVLDSGYDSEGRLILVTQPAGGLAARYEDELSRDSAVIAWYRRDVHPERG